MSYDIEHTYISYLHVNNCVLFLQVQRANEMKKLYMPFYKLYTPRVIRSQAEFTSSYYNYSTTAITFAPSTPSYRRLFKLPLIGGGILNRYADVTVKITVGLQNDIRADYDSDPKFVISDGVRGVGFEMRDETSGHHCRGIEGLMGDTLSSRSISSGVLNTVSLSTFPEEFVITLAPSQRWGSCYYAVSNGVISPASYSRYLYLDQELSIEVYAESTSERYLFNYIIVEIHEN